MSNGWKRLHFIEFNSNLSIDIWPSRSSGDAKSFIPLLNFNFHDQGISRNNRLLPLYSIYPGEKENGTRFGTFHLEANDSSKLSKSLDLENSGHDRAVGEMASEVRFVEGHRFHADSSLRIISQGVLHWDLSESWNIYLFSREKCCDWMQIVDIRSINTIKSVREKQNRIKEGKKNITFGTSQSAHATIHFHLSNGKKHTFPISYSTTLSTNKKGYLWGRTFAMSSKLNTVLTLDVNAEISWALRGAGASSELPSVSSAKMRLTGARIFCWTMGQGARNALAVEARVARMASFIMVLIGVRVLYVLYSSLQ